MQHTCSVLLLSAGVAITELVGSTKLTQSHYTVCSSVSFSYITQVILIPKNTKSVWALFYIWERDAAVANQTCEDNVVMTSQA